MRTNNYQLVVILLVLLSLFSASCGTGEPDKSVPIRELPQVAYLEEVVPPCSPSAVPQGQDPCPSGPPPQVESPFVATHQNFVREAPNFTNMLLGTDLPGISVPHIVVRGTVQVDTTRCELYPAKLPNYSGTSIDISEDADYYCFVDMVISEYLVGEGPPRLTVGIHREVIWPIDVAEWPDDVDDNLIQLLTHLRTQTATSYEGRELVLLLQSTISLAVEAWEPVGLFNIWFVQRTDDGIRAIAQEIDLAVSRDIRTQLDLPLTGLETQIRTARTARTQHIAELSSETTDTQPAPTGTVRIKGGLGNLKPVPLIVTDANHLRNFYQAVGAVYEGDQATVVPPVVVPGIPQNLAVSESWVVTWDPPDRGGEAHWYRLEMRFTSVRALLFTNDRTVNISTYVTERLGQNLDLRVRAENFVSKHGEWTDTLTYTNIATTAPTTTAPSTTTTSG